MIFSKSRRKPFTACGASWTTVANDDAHPKHHCRKTKGHAGRCFCRCHATGPRR